MKKTFSIPYEIALTLLIVVGCQRAEVEAVDPVQEGNLSRTVTFSAGSPETRTAFGEPDGTSFPTFWTENDSEVAVSLNLGKPVTAAVETSDNYTHATFAASFSPDKEGPYTFYVVNPASAVNSISVSRKAWNIQIPAIQTPLPNSVDEKAQVILAKSESMDEIPENLHVQFDHLTAYGRMTLKNVDKALEANDMAGATIVSVDITSEEAFAGSWYYHVEDGTTIAKDPSYTITLKVSDVADASLMENLWFACLPTDVSEKSWTIRVNTDKGSVERSVTFPAGRSFTSGTIGKFSVNMENAAIATTTTSVGEVVYALVKSLDELDEDDDLILANTYSNPTYLLGGTASTSGISPVQKSDSNFTVGTDGYIRIPEGSGASLLYVYSKSESVLTLVCGNYGALSLESKTSGRNTSYYLGWNESSLTEWTVSIDESTGAATISTTVSASNRETTYYLRYSNSYFNATTTSGTVAIYKKTVVYSDETTANPIADENDPILDFEDYGAYLSDTNRQIYTRAEDQISREYGFSSVSFAIMTPASEKVLEFSSIPKGATKNDTFTLTVCRYEGTDIGYFEKFSVIVVKEEGPKLWLSAGDGQGFIVKK